MKHILLVDDDARDVELTLAALEENHLANKVTVAKNGEVALDPSSFRPSDKSAFSGRRSNNRLVQREGAGRFYSSARIRSNSSQRW
jgi:hypothetical protein